MRKYVITRDTDVFFRNGEKANKAGGGKAKQGIIFNGEDEPVDLILRYQSTLHPVGTPQPPPSPVYSKFIKDLDHYGYYFSIYDVDKAVTPLPKPKKHKFSGAGGDVFGGIVNESFGAEGGVPPTYKVIKDISAKDAVGNTTVITAGNTITMSGKTPEGRNYIVTDASGRTWLFPVGNWRNLKVITSPSYVAPQSAPVAQSEPASSPTPTDTSKPTVVVTTGLKAGMETTPMIVSVLSLAGLGAGLYYAFSKEKKFWGYVGYGLLGSIAGGIVGNIANAVVKPK